MSRHACQSVRLLLLAAGCSPGLATYMIMYAGASAAPIVAADAATVVGAAPRPPPPPLSPASLSLPVCSPPDASLRRRSSSLA